MQGILQCTSCHQWAPLSHHLAFLLVERIRSSPRLPIIVAIIRHLLDTLVLVSPLVLSLGGMLRSVAVCTATLTGSFMAVCPTTAAAREAIVADSALVTAPSVSPPAQLCHPQALVASPLVSLPWPREATHPTRPRHAVALEVGTMGT
jgi:hypothetical protein